MFAILNTLAMAFLVMAFGFVLLMDILLPIKGPRAESPPPLLNEITSINKVDWKVEGF